MRGVFYLVLTSGWMVGVELGNVNMVYCVYGRGVLLGVDKWLDGRGGAGDC